MELINNALAAALRTVLTPGDFYADGSCSMHLPLIEVDGVGPIALPLLPRQAAQLVAAAQQAPYGRGGQTLVDTSVRRTWQIEASRVRIGGKHWPKMLADVVERAATGLGAGPGVVAELYKLLVYDKGSFFVSHRDTEKSPGMFATLIVALPSTHTGGELRLCHGERDVQLLLRSDDPGDAAWAAFYADCLHEVLPITSGCRLVLVYNLLRKSPPVRGKGAAAKDAEPRPPSYGPEQARLAQLLRRWCGEPGPADKDSPVKLVYPLEYAYTPAELSFAALKGADAAAAGVLAAAAQQAGCDLLVALLRVQESGSAEYFGSPSGYSRSRYYRRPHAATHDDSEDFEIGEIFDRSLTLAHWGRPDGSAAPLGTLPFIDEEVCPSNALAEMDPDTQHFEEATGNEGASFERSYQRAALVLWPTARRLQVLARAGFAASLPALAGLLSKWAESGAHHGDKLWQEAHALAEQILATWSLHNARGGLNFDASEGLDDELDDDLEDQLEDVIEDEFDDELEDEPESEQDVTDSDRIESAFHFGSGVQPGDVHLIRPSKALPSAVAHLLPLLVRLRTGDQIDALLRITIASGVFSAGDNAAVVQALQLLPAPRAAELLQAAMQANAVLQLAACADLLSRASQVLAWRVHLLDAARAFLVALPGDPVQDKAQGRDWRNEPADASVLRDSVMALSSIDAALADRAVTHCLAWPKTYGLDAVIVPALRLLSDPPKQLNLPAAQRLRAAALTHLQTRAALPLFPPANWQREAKVACRCVYCQMLGDFLRDASQPVWRFKAREADRSHVVSTVRAAAHDVDCTTERVGSPHVLVCTKNQASYQRRVKQRQVDLEDLARLGA